MNDFPPQLTIAEVATLLKVPPGFVEDLCEAQRIGFMRLEGQIRIDPRDVEDFRQRNTHRPRGGEITGENGRAGALVSNQDTKAPAG